MSLVDELKSTYFDTKTGFQSPEFYYKFFNKKFKLKDIKNWIYSLKANQIYKQFKKPKQSDYPSIQANGPRTIYQMDIMVYDRYEFHHYKYILCVIDVYSRYASCRALTNRSNPTILNAMKEIFDEIGKPNNITADNEFNKSAFIHYFEQENINTYFTKPYEVNKNAIVERFNRTLSEVIQKVRMTTGDYDWPNYLQNVVFNYNHRKHRTIGEKPFNVFDGSVDSRQQHRSGRHYDFDVGDKVRFRLRQGTFDKNDVARFSKDVYTIEDMNAFSVILSNGDKYKPYELQKIDDVVDSIPVARKSDVTNDEVRVNNKRVQRKVRKEGIAVLKRVLGERIHDGVIEYQVQLTGMAKPGPRSNWYPIDQLERYPEWHSLKSEWEQSESV